MLDRNLFARRHKILAHNLSVIERSLSCTQESIISVNSVEVAVELHYDNRKRRAFNNNKRGMPPGISLATYWCTYSTWTRRIWRGNHFMYWPNLETQKTAQDHHAPDLPGWMCYNNLGPDPNGDVASTPAHRNCAQYPVGKQRRLVHWHTHFCVKLEHSSS